MNDLIFVDLKARGVLRIDGQDRHSFLQGIVTNDVYRIAHDRAVWSAFLTPQGKFLHEFFMVEIDGAIYLDCEEERRGDLSRRLSIFRLRSKVELVDATDRFSVAAAFGRSAPDAFGLPREPGAAVPFAGGIAFVDPRLSELGARVVGPRDQIGPALRQAGFNLGTLDDYDRLRMTLGVPDGSRDLEVEKSILLEHGFDELHGIDWQKGCFMGQELTARTKYRALIKKRLCPVEIEGATPAPGTSVMLDNKEAGVMRSATNGIGLALLRVEHLADSPVDGFLAGDARVKPRKPAWASF